jgi:glucokinase
MIPLPRVQMPEHYFVGIDLGATRIKFVAIKRDGEVIKSATHPTHDDNFSPAWAQHVRLMLAGTELDHLPADGVAIAAPGLPADDEQSIAWMVGRMSGLVGFDWTRALDRNKPVRVINDAKAALLGEVWQGAAKGVRNVILLTLGTGVGGAAMVDGHLLKGHLGRAGHLGHISLDPAGELDIVNTPGSLEDAIGECTLTRRSNGRFTTTSQLLEATDDDARRIWQHSIRALACGLASLINVLDPELIVLGGGVTGAGEKLFAPLRAEMEKFEWRPHGRQVRIVPAAAGEYAGAIGAAYYAMTCADEKRE